MENEMAIDAQSSVDATCAFMSALGVKEHVVVPQKRGAFDAMPLGADADDSSDSSTHTDPWDDPWGDIIISDDSSDDFDSSDYGDCSVTFYWIDSDGTTRIFGEPHLYPYGTPYNEITLPSDYPQMTHGYWYFTGWSETFTDSTKTLTTDISVQASFSNARISVPIEWNGAEGTHSTDTLNCVWDEMFDALPEVPQKEGSTFSGAYLMTNDGRTVAKTHNSSATGITDADYLEMGSGTTNDGTYIFAVGSCKIVVCWNEPVEWNTLDNLRRTVGAIPSPFADDPSATTPIPDVDDSSDSDEEVNFKTGFPDAYTIPLIDPVSGDVNPNARVITRKQVNTIGNIGTQAQFFEQCGGYYTFDEKICKAIGGYPRTAVLQFFDEANNCMRKVYSLVDNNRWNFLTDGVDGIHWKYIDDNPCLSLKVNYGDFIDLKDTLFVDTGLPEFYEIPYDGLLQFHSFSFCYQQSDLSRELDSEYMYCVTGIKNNPDDPDGNALPVYEHINGGYGAGFQGRSYLDIYNEKTNTTNSIAIRVDGSADVGASVWQLTLKYGAFWVSKAPRYVVTQGSCFLNKGDKIRVRGVYYSTVFESQKTSSMLNNSRVLGRTYTDMDVRRLHLCKFANFYKIGWE